MDDVRTTLRTAYEDLRALAAAIDDDTQWRPTRCAGWCVRDLLWHHLGDAQRALVALATPAEPPADKDAVTYWIDAPGQDDPDARGLRATRTMASAWRLSGVVTTYRETLAAVVVAAERVGGASLVATQGHVLTADDLLETLVVEAVVHHLDLVVGLDHAGPSAGPLALTRRTLDGLLGRPAPAEWDDVTWTLVGTGRQAPTRDQAAFLGNARLPLLG